MLVIRRATPQDIHSIRRIYLSAASNHFVADDTHLSALLIKGGLFVAQRDGEVIGFGGIDLDATEQVKHLYVLPGHQKGGVGSKILGRMEEAGWEAGLEALRLHSAPAAAEFYARHGYEPVDAAEQIGHDHEGVEMIKRKG